MSMARYYLFFLFNLILLISCKERHSYVETPKKFHYLDSIPFKEKIFEIVVSDNLNKDTLSIEKIKRGLNGQTIYSFIKKNNDDSDDVITEKFFDDNENLLFEKKSSKKLGVFSIYESWYDNDKPLKAKMVFFEDSIPMDTIKINYRYFDIGKYSKIKIIPSNGDEIGEITEIIEDKYGAKLKEFLIKGKDTIRTTNYFYANNNNDELIKREVIEHSKSLIEVSNYSNNNINSKILFNANNKNSPIRTLKYLRDDKGFLIKKILINSKNEINLEIKYLKEAI